MNSGGWLSLRWIANTRGSRIALAQRAADGAPVLLKVCTGDLSLFRDEYTLLRELGAPGLLQVQEFSTSGALPAMVCAPLDVVALDEHLAAGPLEIAAALRLGLSLAQALASLHAAGLVHGDLRPANVLVEPAGGAAWLADLGAAVQRRHAPAAPLAVDDWAWVAPEQTGHADRVVDARADFYLLGLLLYRALAGRLPFDADDPLGWAHAHTARMPPLLAALAPQVPEVVSALVSRLLAKEPGQRYRHAQALVSDLARCLDGWMRHGSLEPFALGQDDPPDALQPPRQLHGREPALAALGAALARVRTQGRPELVLVAGPAGIGKTALVRAWLAAAPAARVIGAKFDLQRHDDPGAALAGALHDLVTQLLAESEQQVAAWRQALQAALGGGLQAVVERVPALGLLVGPQPAQPALGPAEARNRLRWVLARFIGVFARPEQPLVMFLDDLHWADAADLALLRDLLFGGAAGALLVVGSCREPAASDARHPLGAWLRQAEADAIPLARIALEPLDATTVRALVADSLQWPAGQAEPLAALIRQRSGGNPFDILQLLTELHAEGLLLYDTARRAWRWEGDRLLVPWPVADEAHPVQRRLQRLPDAVREVLQHAAGLGGDGPLALLSAALGRPEAELEALLVPAVEQGLLACSGGRYRFPHDRVHEAVLAQLGPGQRPAWHLALGRRLRVALEPARLEQHLFVVVQQLNQGAALIDDAAERLDLARLNQRAGRKAKAALSFALAREHLARAAAAWPADGWQRQPDESFALAYELAECEFLVARFPEADARLHALLAQGLTPSQRARAWVLRIRLRLVPGHYGEAAAISLQALAEFGIALPAGDLQPHLAAARAEVDALMAGRSIEALLDAPRLDDADVRMRLGLIVDSFTGLYIAQPEVFPWLVLRAMALVLRHGNCEDSAVVYTYHARVLVADFGEIETAYALSQLAVRLNERLDDRQRRGMLLFSHAGFIHYWRRPYATGRAILDRGFAACVEVGNFAHAALISVNACLYLTEGGERLDELAQQAQRGIDFLRATQSGGTLEVVQCFARFAATLQGRSGATLDGEDQAATVRRLAGQNSLAALAIVHLLEQEAANVLGDHEASLRAAERTAAVLHSAAAMAVLPSFTFHRALALAAVIERREPSARQEGLAEITRAAEALAGWAHHCPENFGARHALLAAELARLQGEELRAERLYEQALGTAREAAQVQHEALACERAAAFHRGRGLPRIAEAWLSDAHAAYARWGAGAKLRQLEAAHPSLRAAAAAALPIDTLALMKASQALSSQIELDALVQTLVSIALQEAGAQMGRLYVPAGEGFELAAEASVLGDQLALRLHRPRPVAQADGSHPLAVLNYVRRSGEPVRLSDIGRPHAFAADAYLRRVQPCSLLCLPLLRRGQPVGALYLEHLQGTHAFTARHESVLGMLAAQAAISLEIAGLYAALKEENEQRRRAEAAAVEWQSRMGRLVDSNIIAVRISDLDGRIVDANDAYLRIVGHTREQMRAGLLTLEGITPPEYRAADEGAARALLEDGRYVPFEKEYLRPDGSRVPVLVGGILVPGPPPQTVGFVLDLSERQRAETERRARLQAEAANEAKSAFLAHMSHEIRTPMNAILGMSQLALQSGLDATQSRYVEHVQRAAESLLGILNDILDLSKIEAGQLEIEALEFNVDEVLDHLATLVAQKAEQKGIELIYALPPRLPRRLVGDPTRLGQVLLNLVSNAIKFTERGEVVVTVALQARDGDGVQLGFEVRDTGIGLRPDEMARLFQPFTQADSSITRRFGGTGLGLAISRRLVALMGGEIGVESEPGRGSRFRFSARFGLPAGRAAEELALAEPLRGLRVLVVDDNDCAREQLTTMARALSLQAEAAADGQAALAAVTAADAADRAIGLLLLDWKMPGIDGVEVARRLAALPLRHPPPAVLMVTAFSRDEARRQAREAAAPLAALLAKPVTPSTLLDACLEVVLPRRVDRAAGAGAELSQQRRALAHARVLLVEDNPVNQELACELLRREGVQVTVAANGLQALDLLAQRDFDAVLMDCQMPELDGYETTRRLRRDPRWARLPVIAMTANAMVGDREQALAAGMNDHVAKPIRLPELFGTLARWLPSAAPVFDAAVLRGSGVLPGSALYQRLLAMFIENARSFPQRYQAAAADPVAATRLAHDLKSDAATLGAVALEGAAAALESALQQRAPEAELQARLDAVLSALPPLLAALRAADAGAG